MIELEIGGMTCASCAARIEKRLNRLAGVSASVNYATERAWVSWQPTEAVTTDHVIAAVAASGYTARLHPRIGEPAAGRSGAGYGYRHRRRHRGG